MIMVGYNAIGYVEICVSIDLDQLQTLREMYPHCTLVEQVGNENVGWTFDGVSFTPPRG